MFGTMNMDGVTRKSVERRRAVGGERILGGTNLNGDRRPIQSTNENE